MLPNNTDIAKVKYGNFEYIKESEYIKEYSVLWRIRDRGWTESREIIKQVLTGTKINEKACKSSRGSIKRKLLQCFDFVSETVSEPSCLTCNSNYEFQPCWAIQSTLYTDCYLLRLVKTRKTISQTYRALHLFTLWLSTSSFLMQIGSEPMT